MCRSAGGLFSSKASTILGSPLAAALCNGVSPVTGCLRLDLTKLQKCLDVA